MKNGAPMNAVTTPIGVSAGSVSTRPGMSARIRNAAPNSIDKRQQTAGSCAGDQPHHVRHDDADEADQAADGTTAAVPSVAATTTTSRDAGDRRPERRRLVVADPQQVEVPAVQQQHDRADDDVRRTSRTSAHDADDSRPRIHVYTSRTTSEWRCRRNVWIAVASDTTATPASTSVDARRGTAERRADDVRHSDRREREDECAARGTGSTGQSAVDAASDREHDRRPEPGTGGDAEQVRVDERVAEHALVAGPGERQHRADEPAEHDPRHADLPDDVPLAPRSRRGRSRSSGRWSSSASGTRHHVGPAGPIDDADQHRMASTRRPASSEPAGASRVVESLMAGYGGRRLHGGRRPPARVLDDARAPARGDVVVHLDRRPRS